MNRYGPFLKEIAWHLLPPGVYVLVMLLFFPYWDMYWLSFDEGYNMMKALLVEQGFPLYTQIWSDQPPLFTHLLAWLIRLGGVGMFSSRRLMLLHSAALIYAAVQFMRLSWGDLAGALTAFFLALLPAFPVLSAAVLVGLPAITFAMVSALCLALWHARRSVIWLTLSALALSLSVMTKLFTAPLAAIIPAGLLFAEVFPRRPPRPLSEAIRPALIWSLTFCGATALLVLCLVGPGNILQLVTTHLLATEQSAYPGSFALCDINCHLREAWPFLTLAWIGVIYSLLRRRWLALYILVWGSISYVFLLNHSPIWFHHQLLVSIPAALLSAGAVAEGAADLRQWLSRRNLTVSSRILLTAGLCGALLIVALRLPSWSDLLLKGVLSSSPDIGVRTEDKLLKKVKQFAPQTEWIVTDLPMLAYLAGLPTPPNLTVISWKRLSTGELTEAEILEIVIAYRPEQVLIGRFHFPLLDAYLEEHYSLVMHHKESKLFVLPELRR